MATHLPSAAQGEGRVQADLDRRRLRHGRLSCSRGVRVDGARVNTSETRLLTAREALSTGKRAGMTHGRFARMACKPDSVPLAGSCDLLGVAIISLPSALPRADPAEAGCD